MMGDLGDVGGVAEPGGPGAVRIKDIVTFEGVRENELIGYGLVVGLHGTGDALRNSAFTRESIEGMLGRLGVGNLDEEKLKTTNTAAVMVTAKLPPFARLGAPVDVVVSSLGDATSLRGGTLLVTPLSAADGEVYAVAQGPVSVGGYSAQGRAASITEGVPTVAQIANGATVEREIDFALNSLGSFRLSLRNPDATTASRIAARVQGSGIGTGQMLDPATVEVTIGRGVSVANAMARIEQLTVTPDSTAKVVIDAKSGTIVIGADVRISEVAISQGGLTVAVNETAQIAQPASFSIGESIVVPETQIRVTKHNSGFAVIDGQVSLRDLVDGLNAIGIGAQETISILQAIKAAGALHAELEII
ncbi:flagellar basal body P-ring protein FlgI [Paracoccus ravus]|uniref:flagellar basal body P-ring protein FlgI n=1 Tax=Paracoccus ravus TaxID=2447760 RepID=UPI00106DDC56|nr:flagellar basal body P-ring protein FlgI [Paracoccus ravus]